MDSGNSGSLQSSSGGGGDDVYDTRTEFNPLPNLQPPPSSSSHQHQHHQPPSSYFDPSSISHSVNPNPNPMYNLDSLWSGNPIPNPICNHNPHKDSYINPNTMDDNINPGIGDGKIGATTRNPKKRTRASRRAPTTVLTTDTTNFRQMVQQFTSIPTAPFSRRLDLYGGGIPLRPSAHKIQLQQPSYLNSSRNFHLPPSESYGFTKQPLHLSNLPNQMIPFQSFSQTRLPQQTNATERENQQTNGDQLPGNEDSWICRSD